MGNPLSPVLANLFLEHVESELLPTFASKLPWFWVRYVDDILALVDTDFKLEDFLNFINNLYSSLKFTHEWEINNKIPFLDVLIHNLPNGLQFSVYRKPTHSNAYLHYFSFHSKKVKLSVAHGLFLRALRICSSSFLHTEINFIRTSLSKLAYPSIVLDSALSKAKHSFYKSSSANKPKPVNFITLPFVNCLDNPSISKLVSSQKSKLAFNYPHTIKSTLNSNVTHPDSHSKAGVYKIPCSSCNKSYYGETGRTLSKRVSEHKRDIVQSKPHSAVAEHTYSLGHFFDFKNANIIVPSNNSRHRRLYESALINKFSNCNLNLGFYPMSSYLASLLINSRTL